MRADITMQNGGAIVASLLLACLSSVAAAEAKPGDARFTEMSRQVAARPEDISAGNQLRKLCRERELQDACIEFFDDLAKAHPLAAGARYNAALAYIDNLPGHSLLAQARLSTHSIEHASAVLERTPADWLALYIRGLNNLYWPTWYRRTDRAIADLSRCVEISEALTPERRQPYMALAHLALGDAYVKSGKVDKAREIWQRGADAHAAPLLAQRLGVAPESLPEEIDKIRSRDVPVDTDIEFYAATGMRTE